MKNQSLLLINLSLLTVFSSPVFAQNSPPPTIINNSSSFQQKLIDWGFSITNCSANAVVITDLSSQETACVQPSSQLNSGNYIYDAIANQIRPDTRGNQTTTRSVEQNAIDQNIVENYTNPTPRSNDPRIADVVFDFIDIYGYNNCLDALLLLYEGRNPVGDNSCLLSVTAIFGNQINRDVMLELVEIANVRATSLLPKRLYPAYGIRRRVAQSIGFVYEIDATNPEIIKLALSGKN